MAFWHWWFFDGDRAGDDLSTRSSDRMLGSKSSFKLGWVKPPGLSADALPVAILYKTCKKIESVEILNWERWCYHANQTSTLPKSLNNNR